MSNPLAIPELVAKVIENLDTKDLVKVSYLNKTWRLEARRKLYQNRSIIIYNFFRGYLNNLRLRSLDLFANLLSVIPFQIFNKFAIFRHAFGLDIKVELLAIRDQFRAEHRRLKRICKKLDKKARKKGELIGTFASYSVENYRARSEYGAIKEKARKVGDQRFEIWKDLVNFEYFIVRFEYRIVRFGGTSVLTDQEINIILDKLQPLQDMEEERRWIESASSTIYWGFEDPDMVV